MTTENPETSQFYSADYFQGGPGAGNYKDYLKDAFGPSNILAETLHRLFRPTSAADIGCAVGFTIKRMRELGVVGWGYDISEWAVQTAGVPYIRQFDVSRAPLSSRFDLVFSYDMVEHIPQERLSFALQNLWDATLKDLVIVPATYGEGITCDPDEPTHLIFHDRQWWLDQINGITFGRFNPELTEVLAADEHSRTFNYSHRILVFSR